MDGARFEHMLTALQADFPSLRWEVIAVEGMTDGADYDLSEPPELGLLVSFRDGFDGVRVMAGEYTFDEIGDDEVVPFLRALLAGQWEITNRGFLNKSGRLTVRGAHTWKS